MVNRDGLSENTLRHNNALARQFPSMLQNYVRQNTHNRNAQYRACETKMPPNGSGKRGGWPGRVASYSLPKQNFTVQICGIEEGKFGFVSNPPLSRFMPRNPSVYIFFVVNPTRDRQNAH